MTMTRKSKILSGIILLELVLLVWAFVPKNYSTVEEQSTNFALSEDDQKQITRFEFGKITLQKQDENWILNEKYKADVNTVKDFFEILKRLEIKRPIAESEQDLQERLPANGVKFTAFSGDRPLLSFYIDGQEKNTFAMLADSEEAFEVYVQGFNIVPYKVFKSDEIRWRNKIVMETNWLSIKKLEVKYREKPEDNFLIEFDSAFYKVAGVEKLDSVRLYNYLKSFEEVRAFQVIENSTVRDSLTQAVPYCTIELQDIDPNRNNVLKIYGNDYSVMGITSKSEHAFLFHPQRFIQTYLMPRQIFEKQK